MRSMSRGFTIIEILVVVVIMTIVSLTVIVAYPNARAEQKLTLAEQTLQAALRAAQQAAINEERTADCLSRRIITTNGGTTPPQRCSDVGIVLEPTRHDIIVFADISRPDEDTYDSNDAELSRIPFPDGVEVLPAAPPIALIFQGIAPTIGLFTSTTAYCVVTSPCEVIAPVMVTLSIGNASRELDVGSYGQVERH